MGSNNSQPDLHYSQKRTNEILYMHQKYDELEFFDFKAFKDQTKLIPPSELFSVAICYPYYCYSVHDIIRQTIRAVSTSEAKKNQFSEIMEYNRVRVLNRCKFRQKFRRAFKDTTSSALQFKSTNDNNDAIANEITLEKILTILRKNWCQKNSQIITDLLTNFKELTGKPENDFTKANMIFPIFSQLMGQENCEAFVPHSDLNLNEFDEEFEELKSTLKNSVPYCCMKFTPTEPLHSLEIAGKVIPHGICSNGTFLFVLTEEKMNGKLIRRLNVYLLYKGMIHKHVKSKILSDNYRIDNETFLFCSQEFLFLKDNGETYQVSIRKIQQYFNFEFEFVKNDKLKRISKACSNGVTYSVIKADIPFQIFDAETDELIMENKNEIINQEMNKFGDEIPIVTNGMFIGILDKKKVIFYLMNFPNEIFSYEMPEAFPKDYNMNVTAVTIDILNNVYFSVTCDENSSRICSHAYTGAPDAFLFDRQLAENINNDSFESFLLKYLMPCAFSPAIPENLISDQNNIENNLKSIVNWISKYNENDKNLVKGLLILLDLNIKKYKSREIAHFFYKGLIDIMNNEDYKQLASALFANNIDLFFDKLDIGEFHILLHILLNGRILNQWAINKLSMSSLLSKKVVDEKLLISIFRQNWCTESRFNENYSWKVDLLLVCQQNAFEEAIEIVEKDPLNLKESELITVLCNYAKLLIDKFMENIIKIMEHTKNSGRKLDYESILYTLTSNFFASVAPITGCVPLANIITSKNAQMIIIHLNDYFILDNELNLFLSYFCMAFSASISSLIRGGSAYQCEDEYKWLINGNFKNGIRDLTPPDLNQAKFFLSNLENEAITEAATHLAYLYQNLNNIISKNEDTSVDQFILAAVIHQTKTSDLLNNGISKDLEQIWQWVGTMRRRIISEKQRDSNENNDSENKQSNKYLANIGILIILDPVLTDYLRKSPDERNEYICLLEQFIQKNDPYEFHKVLKAIPTRIPNVIRSFDNLNSLLAKIIIDGISRVDSFERLGYLLSHEELDMATLNTLEEFSQVCLDLLNENQQITILEALFTFLSASHSFKKIAIEVMNTLVRNFVQNKTNIDLSDPYFITTAGFAYSTSTIPEDFQKLPLLLKSCIIKLILSKENLSEIATENDFISFLNPQMYDYISDLILVKTLFSIFNKCANNEQLNDKLSDFFNLVAESLNTNDCLVFPTLPEIIYGFRSIRNSDSNLSTHLETIMASIAVESSINKIFLLFAIIGGDISDYSQFHAIKNQHGMWLKIEKGTESYCIQIPVTPLCKIETLSTDEITDPVQDVELDVEKGLQFDIVLAFWDVCMKDQGSLLCRLYLQTLMKYIMSTNEQIPNKYLSILAQSAKPYIDFHILHSNQTKLYKSLSGFFKMEEIILQEHVNGFGVIEQEGWTHLFAYNVLKLGDISFIATFRDEGYLVIHTQDPILIQIPSGVYNGSKSPLIISDKRINIVTDSKKEKIGINNQFFTADQNTSIEFIIKSRDKIIFEINSEIIFDSQQICFNEDDNLNIDYSNSCFYDNEQMENFNDELSSVKPAGFHTVNAGKFERYGNNSRYNKMINDYCFNDKLQFKGSESMNQNISRKNEFNICNQLKSVILALTAIKYPQSLDWETSFSLIKSAVVSVGGFDKDRLKEGHFPYHLSKGFFGNCSLNFIQSSNVQIFFNAVKALIENDAFMNDLGKGLIIMAQDRVYHSLIHKKDLMFILPEEVAAFENEHTKSEDEYIIDFPDGSKGIIKIDGSGSWLIDTPIVFLILLWIFIDNCKKPIQRICAKLALVDCMLIKSPMIDKYMGEFLTYMQKKLVFTHKDFNPLYIHHLSTLALKNPDNYQIITFYENEKNCFNMRSIPQSLVSQTINLHEFGEVDFDIERQNLSPTRMNEIIQLLRKYESVNDFPVWYFIPIWKKFSSKIYEKYNDERIYNMADDHADIQNLVDVPLLFTITIAPKNEKGEQKSKEEEKNVKPKVKIYDVNDLTGISEVNLEEFTNKSIGYFIVFPDEQRKLEWSCTKRDIVELHMYKIIQNDILNQSKLMNDIESFAVDWNESDTDDLLSELMNFDFKSKNFLWTRLSALDMTDLIEKYGVQAVQCKAACIYILDMYYSASEALSDSKNEMKRLGKEYSMFFSYQSRLDQFSIKASHDDQYRAAKEAMEMESNYGSIRLDIESALSFTKGKSDDYCDSMIYQMSEAISKNQPARFKNTIWGVCFKGSESIDKVSATNQIISMCIDSFIYLHTGLCIISPNFTKNTPNSVTIEPSKMSDTLVIPYPSRNDKNTKKMLNAFGLLLGAMIRGGLTHDIPFPLFVWNFLAGKPIRKEDVYENDTRLKNEIDKMRNGELNNHYWTYRDWDNVVKPIVGFSGDKFVTPDLVDIYETLVIDLRISSLEKSLTEIRSGFLGNQDIKNTDFLSGGLISFLCCGKKCLNIGEIVKKVAFVNGNEQLKSSLINILNEYDQAMMMKFLIFSTAEQRLPNFFVVPDYMIVVNFDEEMNVSECPMANTAINTISMPIYPTLGIMRDKLNFAVMNCERMDNVYKKY